MRHVCRMQPGDDPRRAHDFLWVERLRPTWHKMPEKERNKKRLG